SSTSASACRWPDDRSSFLDGFMSAPSAVFRVAPPSASSKPSRRTLLRPRHPICLYCARYDARFGPAGTARACIGPRLRVLEALGHPHELSGIHRLRRLQQVAFFFPDSRGAHVLRGPSHHRHVLVTDVAAGERRLELGQL